jgi:PAS domain S-box-containing protein
VSPAFDTIWGRSRSTAFAAPEAWATGIHPDDRTRVLASVRSVADGTERTDEFRIVQPCGTTLWARSRSFPLPNAASQVERVGVVVEDITELREAEERFRKSQKLEAVGRLAAGIAHDFNNLLTVILGSAQFVTERLEPGTPDWDDMQHIRDAGRRATDLTRQLLAYSRQQVLQPEILDLREVVGTVETMLTRMIGEDIVLTTELPPHPATVYADRSQLDQVLVNLAVNARDAMPGGGKLTLQVATVTLDEQSVAQHQPMCAGTYRRLIVSDTGCGMDEHVHAQLFEPFFTTKAPGQGTGLGLATVYGVVKQSGGYIWCRSAPGLGTSFEIYLPVADGRPASASAPSAADGELGGAETILLVEDDERVRAVVGRALTALGYRTLIADGADQAQVIAQQHPDGINLMLTDLVMPGLNGRQLAEWLAGVRPDTKVLLMSGYADDTQGTRGTPATGHPFLRKPFTLEELGRAVRDALGASDSAPAERDTTIARTS